MKILASLLLLIPLWAQEPAKAPVQPDKAAAKSAAPADTAASGQDAKTPADAAKPADAAPSPDAAKVAADSAATGQDAKKPADQPAAKPADQPAAAAAAAPAENPAGEGWLKGSINVGYRWIPNISGNQQVYRSVVNLGEGPKLLDADFTLTDPKKRVFDRVDVHAASWGGDPYNTLRIDMQKERWYRLTADYRNISYFNFLPSFADPTLSQGILVDQNSYDTHIRSTDILLDLLPAKWITPYVAFSRNTQFGRGITVFHTDQNQYPVASAYSDQTNNYRAGVRFELGRYHFTVEQGGTTYKEDQGASDNTVNPGNFTGTFLGSTLPLNSLNELYRIRGDSVYTKALLAANPFSWMTVTGQFVYARPRTDVNYTAASNGTFYLQDTMQFYNSGQDLLTGDANMPHKSGSVTVEVRPLRRLRIVEYFMTDRLDNAANALLTQALSSKALTINILPQLSTDQLNLNYNQEEVDAFYDVTSKLTLRGGYRYVWGDTTARAPLLTGLDLQSANLSRHVGIAGINYRIGQKFRLTADAEGSSSGQTFFRTSLQDYQKAHIRASYQLSANLRLAADFSLLNNSDPDPDVKLDFSSKVESASVYWTPNGGKWANILLDYSRSAVRSNILYLVPQVLAPTTSVYRENAHAFTMVTGVKWLSFGGSLFLSSGSRPTNYFQPLARLTVPVHKHVQWITEWRWYSMSESFYAFENFHSNQLTSSLRFTR